MYNHPEKVVSKCPNPGRVSCATRYKMQVSFCVRVILYRAILRKDTTSDMSLLPCKPCKDMSHFWMGHTSGRFMAHIRIRHGTRVWETCHLESWWTSEFALAHVWNFDVTCMNVSCQTHMSESCRISMSHVTLQWVMPPTSRRVQPLWGITSHISMSHLIHIHTWVMSQQPLQEIKSRILL